MELPEGIIFIVIKNFELHIGTPMMPAWGCFSPIYDLDLNIENLSLDRENIIDDIFMIKKRNVRKNIGLFFLKNEPRQTMDAIVQSRTNTVLLYQEYIDENVFGIKLDGKYYKIVIQFTFQMGIIWRMRLSLVSTDDHFDGTYTIRSVFRKHSDGWLFQFEDVRDNIDWINFNRLGFY